LIEKEKRKKDELWSRRDFVKMQDIIRGKEERGEHASEEGGPAI